MMANIRAFQYALCFWISIYCSTWLHAQQNGGVQPEFSNFTSVSTEGMVNPFTGDFKYNIPILTIPGDRGSGYALSLSYDQNSVGPEQQASWVGFGWSLNPGSIIRQVNGVPDDAENESVTYWQKDEPNITLAANKKITLDLLGNYPDLGNTSSIIWNNQSGFFFTNSFQASFFGTLTLGYKYDSGGDKLNPIAKFSPFKKFLKKYGKFKVGSFSGSINSKSLADMLTWSIDGPKHGFFTKAKKTYPVHTPAYNGYNIMYDLTASGRPTGLPGGLLGGVGVVANLQFPEDKVSTTACGFLYQYNADKTAVTDYTVSNAKPYAYKNPFLPIPQKTKDQYILTGEGVVGSMQLYSRTHTIDGPAERTNKTTIMGVSLGVDAGTNLGLKPAIGGGSHWVTVKKDPIEKAHLYQPAPYTLEEEAYFFRFNNDFGGQLLRGNNFAAPSRATWKNKFTRKEAALSSDEFPAAFNQGRRSGRSSYVGFHTNADMRVTTSNNAYPNRFAKAVELNNFVNRNDPAISKHIGEISVVNEAGLRYSYGLPVYSRKHYDMQYRLFGPRDAGATVRNKQLAFVRGGGALNLATRIKGTEQNAPRVNAYLLTSITTQDYQDLSGDGPSPDDLGGYTKFHYTKAHGTLNKEDGGAWYSYRSPYRGLHYQVNEKSDLNDDMGAVSGGEKEIYYLEKVETRTHIAIFHLEDRQDGLSAPARDATGSAAFLTTETQGTQGNQRLKLLRKIELFAKDPQGGANKLLQTTHFKYDYSLMKGVLDAQSPQDGRLTLKAVWTTYNGAYDAEVHPYQFSYEYPTYPTNIQNKYPAVVAHKNNLTAADQNPDYAPTNVDRWGKYQADGATRYSAENPWVDQTPVANFDPAAWQLKQIVLPTKGEVHIQYEQDDYLHVEDQRAHVMAELTASTDLNDKKYYINTQELGWSSSDLQDAKKLIEELYVKKSKNNKLYFDMLFLLEGTDMTRTCLQERITGYAEVESVGIDNSGLFVKLRSSKLNTPTGACRQYIRENKMGKLNTGINCDPDVQLPIAESGVDNRALALAFLGQIAQTPAMVLTRTWLETSCCQMLTPNRSYLRLPALKAKKGGGLRVKRLITFDQGLEANTAHLYGTEYVYEEEQNGQWISSGVATNEPQMGKYENSLVRPMVKFATDAKHDKTKWSSIEGPLGENFRPAASIGYAQVLQKNIFDGPSNEGFHLSRYHTAREFPTQVQLTAIDKQPANLSLGLSLGYKSKKKGKVVQPAKGVYGSGASIGLQYSTGITWLSQGYLFELNDMHGKKALESHQGYQWKALPSNSTYWRDTSFLISQQQYEYYKSWENDRINVMSQLGTIEQSLLGVEADYTVESKGIEENKAYLSIGADISVTPTFLAFFIGPNIGGSYSTEQLHTNVSNKVIHHTSLLKSVKSIDNGIPDERLVAAYDPLSGKPVMMETPDEYHALEINQQPHEGWYTNYTLPATQFYPNLGQKASNEHAVLKANAGTSMTLDRNNAQEWVLDLATLGREFDLCSGLDKLHPGDLVHLIDDVNGQSDFAHIHEIKGSKVKLLPSTTFQGIGFSNNNANIQKVKVIASGKTNELTQGAGTILTYGRKNPANTQTVVLPEDQRIFRQELAEELGRALDILRSGGMPARIFINRNLTIIQEGECIPVENSVEPERYREIALVRDGNNLELRVLHDNGELSGDACRILIDKFDAVEHITLDEFGNLIYFQVDLPCRPIVIDITSCINWCPNAQIQFNNVVQATAMTMSDDWAYDLNDYIMVRSAQPSGINGNLYETNQRGQWRTASSYSYADEMLNRENGRKVWNSGLFQSFFLFNHDNPTISVDAWRRQNKVEKYTPFSAVLEQKDALETASCTKYGYQQTVPYLVAANATTEEVQFESFEQVYGGTRLESGLTLNTANGQLDPTVAHSGQQSYKLTQNSVNTPQIRLSSNILNDGLLVQLWVRDTSYTVSAAPINASINSSSNAQNLVFEVVARVGEWRLLEAVVRQWPAGFNTGDPVWVNLQLDPVIPIVWLDDIKLQPLKARVECYIYDPADLKLRTSLNPEHFGQFYQYNGAGQLVRQWIETERGKKMLQEQQYHLPGVVRSSLSN